MGLEITNYSFHPVHENVKEMGVVELSDKANQMLKSLLEFDLTPTRQEIRERCRGIVKHALFMKHKAVFLRNYEIYQSELVNEFQRNEIRVFVPVYKDNRYSENIVSIIEVPNNNHPELIESKIYLLQNGPSNQLFVEGNLDSGIQVKFNLAEGETSDIINWFQSFIKQIRAVPIPDFLNSKLGVQYRDIYEFTQGLIQILYEIKNLNLKTDEISEMINIIRTASIIDSEKVQEYITLTNYATVVTSNYREEFLLINKARNYYNSLKKEERDVVTSFGTNPFKRLGFRRSNKLIYNPAYLHRNLGFLKAQIYHWVDAETNFRKSIDLYNQYDNNEIDDLELDIPYNNLFSSMIILGKNDQAREMINQRIERVGDLNNDRTIVLKRYMSRINRNEGNYDKALEILLELQGIIDEKRNLNDYYTINNQCAIIYYLKAMPETSFELLRQVIAKDEVSTLVKSYANYLYNLILFSENKKLNQDIIEDLPKLRNNYSTRSYLSLISILAMIQRNDPIISIISKLKEFMNSFPNKVILGFIILANIYAANNNWEELGVLVDSMLPISTKHSILIKIKIFMCKYHLGIILGNHDIHFKNMIERIAHEENLDITKYYFDNDTERSVEDIKGILDMNLVKIDDYIFD